MRWPATRRGRLRASRWNVATAITCGRLGLVPVVGVLLAVDGAAARVAAAVVFVVATLSDQVDGLVARRRDLVTDLGVLLDPVADKALIGTVLVGLSLLGELPWWVTVVVLVREVGVTLLRLAVRRHGVMPASRGGKVKTALQSLALLLYLLPLEGAPATARAVVMGAAVVVTVVTGLDYVVRAVRLRASGRRSQVAAVR